MSTTSPRDPGGTGPRSGDAPPADRRADSRLSVGLWSSLAVLLRRWPVVVLGLVLTLLAGVAVMKVVPSSYAATGNLLVSLPPEQSKGGTAVAGASVPVNPYIGTRGFVGDLLIAIMNDTDAEARVAARGGSGSFKVVMSLGDAALVKVDTTGRSAEEALRTWTATAEETKESLTRLQQAKNVPENLLVSAEPLTRPTEAQRQSGSRVRALLAVVALGFGATVFLAFAVEAVAQARRLRRGEPPARPRRRAGAGRWRRPGSDDAYYGLEDDGSPPPVDEPVFGRTEEYLISQLLDGRSSPAGGAKGNGTPAPTSPPPDPSASRARR